MSCEVGADMEETVKVFKLVEEESDDGWYVRSQEVYDGDRSVFDVWNLDDCPEDAIIGRSLFDAHDWLAAVNYGIKLARQGYANADFVTEGN